MECENQSEVLEHKGVIEFGDDVKVVSGDDNMKPSSMVFNDSLDDSETSSDDKMRECLQEESKKETTDGSNVIDENDEGGLGVRSCKWEGKEKDLEGFECIADVKPKKVKTDKDEVKVTGRLLRSRTMTNSGSVKVVENSLNESVVGFKRQMQAECFDQVLTRPKKKQKCRGRPPKKQGEPSKKRKIKDRCFDQIEIQEVNERSELVGQQKKKQKRRGRPPKKQGEPGKKRKIKDGCFDQIEIQEVNEGSQLAGQPKKKQKRRGRPPKIQSETGKQQKKTQMKKHKDTASDVKEDLVIQHVQNQNSNQGQESDINVDSKEKVIVSEESNNNATIAETVSIKPLKSQEARRKQQELVREQIVSMIMKASWTIEYRPREGRSYLDAVYVDQRGRTHWSITKAYFSLKKRVDEGNADEKEVSAFTPIPDEEMNVLFRSVSKIRCDKNTKKKKRSKDICKAEVVISGDAPFNKPPNKKGKDLKKRKESHDILKVKAKKAKPRRERRVNAESAVERAHIRKPCLVARSSSKGLDQNDDDCILNRKRNICSWMIDSGVVMPGCKLLYGDGRMSNRLLEGQVTVDGIHCSCCNEVLDISSFVSHGGGKLYEAIKNIYHESGSSLSVCLLESWRKEVESTNIVFNSVDVTGGDPHDDTCNICGDGGDLICCDGCPSTFHQSCLDIQNFPSGDWHCIFCCCKFCGLVACDASHHASDTELVKCCLCEEKFHPSCLQEGDVINGSSCSLSFCERKCQELYEQLQTYIGVKFELKDGYSWSLLKRYELDDDPMKVECNSRLAVAFSVMDECFVPIIDERSGVSRIHNVVYNCGSNFKRLDYSGFFTAVLEKDGEFISAASIRIRGNRLAEMPFIGTRNMYRRQGMCRRLLDAIEGALSSLGVAELMIPAIPDLFQTWTKVFGFEPFDELLRQAMKSMCLIVFPGTDILHKPLLKDQFADKNLSPVAVSDEKAVGRVTVENDENTLHLENKSSDAKGVFNCAILDDKAVGNVTLENDENTLHLENKSSDAEVAFSHAVSDHKAVVHVTLENDENTLHLEKKSSDAKGVFNHAVLDDKAVGRVTLEYDENTLHIENKSSDAKAVFNHAVSDVKAEGRVTVESDENTLHLENKSSGAKADEQTTTTHLDPETPTTTFQKSEIQNLSSSDDEHKSAGLVKDNATVVKTSPEVVPKNSFDLNLQPALTDTDTQLVPEEFISRDLHICNGSGGWL